MSNVVNISRPKNGDKTFVRCSCTPEGSDFIVVAIVNDPPIISCLLCPECETEIPVNNGYLQMTTSKE